MTVETVTVFGMLQIASTNLGWTVLSCDRMTLICNILHYHHLLLVNHISSIYFGCQMIDTTENRSKIQVLYNLTLWFLQTVKKSNNILPSSAPHDSLHKVIASLEVCRWILLWHQSVTWQHCQSSLLHLNMTLFSMRKQHDSMWIRCYLNVFIRKIVTH